MPFLVIPAEAGWIAGGEPGPRSDLIPKVAPLRIGLFDQLKLPLAPPSLEALFLQDRLIDAVIGFEIDEPLDAIALGEAARGAFAMLLNAAHEGVGDAMIERSVAPACKNIDVVGVHLKMPRS